MLPLILDVTDMTIAIIGSGAQARRRLQMVDAAGAEFVLVYAADAEAEMRELAGDRLIESWPSEADIARCHVIYVANVEDSLAEQFTAQGRAHKTLVNVEDVKPLCDFPCAGHCAAWRHVADGIHRRQIARSGTAFENGFGRNLSRRMGKPSR